MLLKILYIHNSSYSQKPCGSQRNIDLLSVYLIQIEERKIQKKNN